MKKVILVMATLLLATACSKEKAGAPPLPATGKSNAKQALAVLEATAQFDSASINRAAAESLEAGIPLSTYAAERCWQAEAKRPEAAIACLLAWSIGHERSAPLEQAAAQKASSGRAAAIAAIRAEFPIGNLGIGELEGLLRQLSGDPVWLRSSAVLVWLRTHAVPGIPDVEEILKLVSTQQVKIPADYRSAYLVLAALKPAAAGAMLNDHCGPLVSDDLRVRCWRFLSTFIEPRTGQGLPAELQAWVPPTDRSWQLFQLAMPSRAKLMARYLNH